MTTKRIVTALAAVALGSALLAGCTPSANPTPKPTESTAAPEETRGPVAPPESEEDAIKAADAVLTEWFEVRGEVNATGGTDTAPLEELSTGKALEATLNDAAHIASGPQLNVDGENIDGPVTTEGAITYETVTAYGQEWEGTENGLVTINACQDGSDYKVFASDGSAGMQPENQRLTFDYQVIYDAERQAWLVYDLVSLNEPC